MKPKNPFVVLAILDGWGIAPGGPGNAISQAITTNYDKLKHSYPHTWLQASGEAVGLPRGEDGNTETGHLNLGAGRIVYQDLQRINLSIADGTFFNNKVLINAFEHSQKYNSNLHLLGLVGAGGVHSNIEHLFALLQLSKRLNFTRVFIHIFSDGRDSPPTAAKTYVKNLKNVIDKEKVGQVASIMGRYWAMDRDQRWDRTEKAYLALTQGTGSYSTNVLDAIDASYADGKTDEFITPTLITGNDSKPVALIKENDSVIFFNFRIDRPRQLTKAFCYRDFSRAPITFDFDPFINKYLNTKPAPILRKEEPFKRGPRIENLFFVTMTEYDKTLRAEGTTVAFPTEEVQNPLSEVISVNNHKQLKVTESEKERFVTFYFNGLRENPFPLEESIIIPSLKVATYDQRPEMKADEITKTVLDQIEQNDFSLIVINYANPDMVGHSGNIGATVKGLEVVDECLGKLANFTLAYKGYLLITADHGNAEEMINPVTGDIDTEHSTFPVPFIAIAENLEGKVNIPLRSGILADIAPTILELLNLPIPENMTGRNLLKDLNIS